MRPGTRLGPVTEQPHRPESPRPTPLRPETLAVIAGRPPRVVDAPLNPPVVFASTYIGAHDTNTAKIGYGRYGNPTWHALEEAIGALEGGQALTCLLYTSPSPRDGLLSRMPSSA